MVSAGAAALALTSVVVKGEVPVAPRVGTWTQALTATSAFVELLSWVAVLLLTLALAFIPIPPVSFTAASVVAALTIASVGV